MPYLASSEIRALRCIDGRMSEIAGHDSALFCCDGRKRPVRIVVRQTGEGAQRLDLLIVLAERARGLRGSLPLLRLSFSEQRGESAHHTDIVLGRRRIGGWAAQIRGNLGDCGLPLLLL